MGISFSMPNLWWPKEFTSPKPAKPAPVQPMPMKPGFSSQSVFESK